MHGRRVGVWLDHRNAVIVALEHGPPHVERLSSHVESRVRMTGGSRGRQVYFHQGVAPEKHRDEKIRRQIGDFLDEIVRHIGSADELFIMGPGQARTELATLIEGEHPFSNCRVAVEPADKLTEGQIVARVRKHFKGGVG